MQLMQSIWHIPAESRSVRERLSAGMCCHWDTLEKSLASLPSALTIKGNFALDHFSAAMQIAAVNMCRGLAA